MTKAMMGGLGFPLMILALLVGCVVTDPDEPVSDKPAHHAADGFKNLHIEHPKKNLFDFLIMKHFGDTNWADHATRAAEVSVRSLELEPVLKPAPERLQISWLGHSTFLIQSAGINVLTDPIFSDRASPFSFAGPERYARHVVNYDQLPKIDYVIISHSHYDHLDRATIRRLGDQPIYLVPLRLKTWFVEQGISADQVHEFDWWDKAAFGGLHVQAMPSQHWSARTLFDRHQTLWASWFLKWGGRKIWFAGDTGYNSTQFKQIGEVTGGVDVALIPIGGYLPRSFMGLYHVNPAEAIMIHTDIGAETSIGMHWGTFPLTAEGPIDPVVELRRQVGLQNLRKGEFMSLAIGETLRW